MVTKGCRSNHSALLSVNSLVVRRRTDETLILDGIDLEIGRGEAVAIVGESGSGKSVMARALVGLLPAGLQAEGDVSFSGVDMLRDKRIAGQQRGRGVVLLLQDPFTSLDPLAPVGKQIVETIQTSGRRGTSPSSSMEVAASRLAEVGITESSVVHRKPHQLSGGMRQRVAIAASLAANPSLLIADEPTTALDVTTQREILRLIGRLQSVRAMSLLLVTHDLRIAFSICDRVYVLYGGSILEHGRTRAVERDPRHPYTAALIAAEPEIDSRTPVRGIPGQVPRADDVKSTCAFVPRCDFADPKCVAERPPLRPIGDVRETRCVRIDDISGGFGTTPVEGREDGNSFSDNSTRNSSAPVLSVSSLSKAYRIGHTKVDAVRRATFDVMAGECVALVGESGSGKSTIARCIVGLEHHDNGVLSIRGIGEFDYRTASKAETRKARRAVQMVFQDPYSSLSPARSIGVTIADSLRARRNGEFCSRADVDAQVGELLERVGLSAAHASRRPMRLSGGERQRVAIARALAVRPEVLICDEPVSALDVSVQAQILELLRELRDNGEVSLLFITHDLSVLRQIADRVVVLYRGEVVESGCVDVVLGEPSHAYTRELLGAAPRRGTKDWLHRPDLVHGDNSGFVDA